jgi:hypothetical protein
MNIVSGLLDYFSCGLRGRLTGVADGEDSIDGSSDERPIEKDDIQKIIPRVVQVVSQVNSLKEQYNSVVHSVQWYEKMQCKMPDQLKLTHLFHLEQLEKHISPLQEENGQVVGDFIQYDSHYCITAQPPAPIHSYLGERKKMSFRQSMIFNQNFLEVFPSCVKQLRDRIAAL